MLPVNGWVKCQAGALGLGQAHRNGLGRSRVPIPWQSQKLKVLRATSAALNGSHRAKSRTRARPIRAARGVVVVISRRHGRHSRFVVVAGQSSSSHRRQGSCTCERRRRRQRRASSSLTRSEVAIVVGTAAAIVSSAIRGEGSGRWSCGDRLAIGRGRCCHQQRLWSSSLSGVMRQRASLVGLRGM